MEITQRLVGHEVEQVWIWYSLRLVLDLDGTYVEVTNFRYFEPDGVEHEVDIEQAPEKAGPVLGVLHRQVTSAEIEDWELRLGFDNGARLVCPPDSDYEAWAVAATDEQTLHCPPLG